MHLRIGSYSINAFSCNKHLADNAQMDKDNLKTRLSALLKERGLSETEVAKMAGTSQSTLHRVITGEIASPRTQTIEKLANALDVSYSYLIEGDSNTRVKDSAGSYISAADIIKQQGVPLIEWELLTSESAKETATKVLCPTAHGRNTFATRVKDNTMTAQYGRSYPEGSIIFIDPDRAKEAKSGDRVFAVIEGSIPSFKQYGESDGQRYLQSINLQYPIITRPFEIKGLVIGCWTPEN